MTQLLGPRENSRMAYKVGGTNVRSAAGLTATIYTDAAATVPAAINTYDGTATPGALISGSQVVIEADSEVPRFWFPNNVATLYIKVGTAAAAPIVAEPAIDGDAALGGLRTLGIGAAQAVSGEDVRVSAPPAMWFPKPAETVLSTFAASHGWVHSGTGTQTDDTVDYLLGTQSMKLVTDGIGGSNFSTLTLGATFNLDIKNLAIALKVDAYTFFSDFQIRVSSNGFADANFHYCKPLASGATQKWIGANVWDIITVGRHDSVGATGGWQVSGTGATLTAIDSIRFKAVDTAGGVVTFHVNLLSHYAQPANGVISLVFDDSRLTHSTFAAPVMDKYRYRGTSATIVGQAGATAEGVTNPGSAYMTAAMVKALQYSHGWEVACHAYSNVNGTTQAHALGYDAVSQANTLTDIVQLKNWHYLNGYRGVHGLALPHGTWNVATTNTAVLDQMRQHFDWVRTTYSNTWETFPPADPHRLRGKTVGTTGGDTAATLLALVDQAIAKKFWLILNFHHLPVTSSSSTDFDQAQFVTFIDGLASRGAVIKPIGEVLRYGVAA